jgi:hypothetical protein
VNGSRPHAAHSNDVAIVRLGEAAASDAASEMAAVVDAPCEILRRLARHKVRYDIAGCIFERTPNNLLHNAFV